jgi:hypothetical protein
LDAEARLRAEERRRVDDPNYAFNYRPEFHAWCDKYTCSDAKLAELTAALIDGDGDILQIARDEGLAYAVNHVRGRVERLYVICARQNSNGRCNGYEARDAEASR